MKNISNTLELYLDYLPLFLIALLISFLITPVIGYFAKKLKIVDIPANLRKFTDKTKKTRIKKQIVPRAGGVAFVIPFLLLVIFFGELDKQIIAILIGVVILTINGVLDDRYELRQRHQFIAQVLAALIAVAAGISIDRIQSPFDTYINFRLFVIPLNIAKNMYSIALPADIITLIWILIMINAINWIFGIDGLGEGISFIAFIAILFISVKSGNIVSAFLAAIAAGGILGFLPYNISPSKILSGTTGEIVYGFLIATLSILGGVKVSTSVIVLIIPIIDMVWVMIGRINRHGLSNVFEVFQVTTQGDDTHLHHRLLKLGFSVPQVALIEWTAVGICAVLAFASAGLPKITIISIIGVVILCLFLGVSTLIRRGIKLNSKKEDLKRVKKEKGDGETPESRYAY